MFWEQVVTGETAPVTRRWSKTGAIRQCGARAKHANYFFRRKTACSARKFAAAELVSWSAVLTLREAGCATVGMVSAYPHSEAYAAFRMPGRLLMRGPVFTRSRIVRIDGKVMEIAAGTNQVRQIIIAGELLKEAAGR